MRQTAQTLLSNFYTMYGFLTAMAIVADAKSLETFQLMLHIPSKIGAGMAGKTREVTCSAEEERVLHNIASILKFCGFTLYLQ